jgi:hypothetical protein
MPFFPEECPKPAEAPGARDIEMARRLGLAVRKLRKTNRAFSSGAWARSFVDLRRLDGITQERIENAFKWYLDNFAGRYTPQAFSGKSFRAKFLSIETAMERDLGPRVEIGEVAQRVAKWAQRRFWPKGTKELVPAVCQISLDSLEEFQEQRRNLAELLRRGRLDLSRLEVKRLLATSKLLDARLGSPAQFVGEWMLDANDAVARWRDWSGDLKAMAFRPDAKAFRRMGRGWLAEYCGDPRRFDAYMETLTNES